MKTPPTDRIGSEGIEFIVAIPKGKKRLFKTIFNAANEEGTIQAMDARGIFSRPENHTAMSLAKALRLSGFTLEAV